MAEQILIFCKSSLFLFYLIPILLGFYTSQKAVGYVKIYLPYSIQLKSVRISITIKIKSQNLLKLFFQVSQNI